MTEPILSSAGIQYGYCHVCEEPTRVGALKLKGWPHTPLVCPACLRKLAVAIELDGTPPTAVRLAESRDA